MEAHPLVWLQGGFADDVRAAGLDPIQQRYHPEAFGSAYSVYAKGRVEVRIVRDGREGAAFLQTRARGTTPWTAVGHPLTEDDLEGAVIAEDKVDDWSRILRNL